MKTLIQLLSFSFFKPNSDKGQLLSAIIKILTALAVLLEHITANGQHIEITALCGFIADFVANLTSQKNDPYGYQRS